MPFKDFTAFPACREILLVLPQKQILRGYHIRLAHGYMDGGMDSLAEV